MIAKALLCALCCSVLSSTPAAGGTPGRASKQIRPADNTAVVEDLLDQYAQAMRNRTGGRGRDAEGALLLLKKMGERFETCGPRDRKEIVKYVERGLERFDGEEAEERLLVFASANILGSMGPESVDPLLDLVVDKNFRTDLELQRRLILSLGRTRHADSIPRLKKLLHHSESMIEASAAEALGEFVSLEEADRKEVFYALLTRLLDAKALVDQDEFNRTDRLHFDAIIGAMTTSLQRLSNHDEREPEEWQRFWNKNKNKSWGTVTT